MSEVVIEVRDVVKRYGDVVAVAGVSFDVVKSEVFGLLGPNGAGKTTLLNVIVGVLRPDEGRVTIKGIDVVSMPFKVKKLIGFLPQENPLYPWLTGEENLVLYASIYGIPRDEAKRRARELLELFGLEEDAKKRVSKYSGGMMRKLSLATALIHDPEILILDEPTTGLDPNMRREFWGYVNDLRRKGKTVILSTHYMEEADVLSSRVAIMDKGKILVLDTPENLKKSLGPYASINIEFKAIDGEHVGGLLKEFAEGGIACREDVCRVLVRNPDVAVPKITSKLYSSGVKIVRLSVEEPTLEDVFIKLTGRRLE